MKFFTIATLFAAAALATPSVEPAQGHDMEKRSDDALTKRGGYYGPYDDDLCDYYDDACWDYYYGGGYPGYGYGRRGHFRGGYRGHRGHGHGHGHGSHGHSHGHRGHRH